MTVPLATGSADFSIRRSKRQRGAKELTDTGDSIRKCLVTNHLGDFGWGQGTVDAEEVSGESSNMRSSHGSSLAEFSLPVIPGGKNVNAGGPDIDGGTIIGEVGLCVIESGSGDGDRFLNTSRRVPARILGVVPRAYDDGNTVVIKLKMEAHVSGVARRIPSTSTHPFDSPICSGRNGAAYAYRSDRGTADPRYFFRDPINAGDTVVGDMGQSPPMTRL